MGIIMVCIALNGSNHTVQIDPETSTLSTICEYVEGVTKLQKNDYYVTVNSYTPIRENVTLHLYNVTVNSTLVVHICGHGGQGTGIVDRTSSVAFLESLPTVEEVQSRVNKRYAMLTHTLPDGTQKPVVCAICDEFIISTRDLTRTNPRKILDNRSWFEWNSFPDPDRTAELEAAYTFPTDPDDPNLNFAGLALSPRSHLGHVSEHHLSQKLFTTCAHCYRCIYKNSHVPLKAISNRNYVGCTPQCLLDLTDIEVALLTPVKQHGICLNVIGGTSLCLKGTFAFMRVKERSTARGIAQLEAIGLQKNIVVLLNGNLTPFQHQQAHKQAKIRTDKVLRALEWMCVNHKRWKHVNLEEIRQELAGYQPVFIDKSKECASTNSNIEEEEVYSFYYPDGATTQRNGGFDEPGAFRNYAKELKEKGFDPEFKCKLEKNFVTEGADTLMDSCLLQFPYGIGGFDERRTQANGSFSRNIDLVTHLEHLTKVSQPMFQRPLFQLIAFSFFCKKTILQTARFQLKGTASATALATGLTFGDVRHAAKQRGRGNRFGGTRTARKLLDACDASGRALPHTNEASGKARSTGEAIQHPCDTHLKSFKHITPLDNYRTS